LSCHRNVKIDRPLLRTFHNHTSSTFGAALVVGPNLYTARGAQAAIVGLPCVAVVRSGGDPEPQVDVTIGTTDGNQHVVNEDHHADGVEIGGTGTPSATGVAIGTTTETTTVAMTERGKYL
jgi:hypothetical protein